MGGHYGVLNFLQYHRSWSYILTIIELVSIEGYGTLITQ